MSAMPPRKGGCANYRQAQIFINTAQLGSVLVFLKYRLRRGCHCLLTGNSDEPIAELPPVGLLQGRPVPGEKIAFTQRNTQVDRNDERLRLKLI